MTTGRAGVSPDAEPVTDQLPSPRQTVRRSHFIATAAGGDHLAVT